MNIFAGHSDNRYALFMDTNQELKTSEYLKGIVSNLPEKPGIYQYLNAEGTIIYVGKPKPEAESLLLFQQRASTRKNPGIGKQDCRHTLYRGKLRRRCTTA